MHLWLSESKSGHSILLWLSILSATSAMHFGFESHLRADFWPSLQSTFWKQRLHDKQTILEDILYNSFFLSQDYVIFLFSIFWHQYWIYSGFKHLWELIINSNSILWMKWFVFLHFVFLSCTHHWKHLYPITPPEHLILDMLPKDKCNNSFRKIWSPFSSLNQEIRLEFYCHSKS